MSRLEIYLNFLFFWYNNGSENFNMNLYEIGHGNDDNMFASNLMDGWNSFAQPNMQLTHD